MEACLFCSIAAGQSPANTVYQDELILGFTALHPATAGHMLVIPREHTAALCDLDGHVAARLFTIAMQLEQSVRLVVPNQGCTLLAHEGEAASQPDFHVHLHIIPRFPDDGVHLDRRARAAPRVELDRVARLIGEAYGARRTCTAARTAHRAFTSHAAFGAVGKPPKYQERR